MPSFPENRIGLAGSLCLPAFIFCLCICAANAQQLPIKTFTVADGLPQNSINQIVQDSRGFIWFCTGQGLSRYDGYTFRNFGVEHGLPDRRVQDFLETREGERWIATYGGIVLFNPNGQPSSQILKVSEINTDEKANQRPMFTTLTFAENESSARYVIKLLQDHAGTIWMGTHQGLFRLAREGKTVRLYSVDIGLPDDGTHAIIYSLYEDKYGTLWIGSEDGLYRRWADGHVEHYAENLKIPRSPVRSIFADEQENIWVAVQTKGLYRLTANGSLQKPHTEAYFTKNGTNELWINDIIQTDKDEFWLANSDGIIDFFPYEADKSKRFQTYTRSSGIGFNYVNDLMSDNSGNVWLGTRRRGAIKISRNGFSSYGTADGIAFVRSIFEDNNGELCFSGFVTNSELDRLGAKVKIPSEFAPYFYRLGKFKDKEFAWVHPNFPSLDYYGWGDKQIALQDKTGEWWIATGKGLLRFPKTENIEDLKKTKPKKIYTTRGGLTSDDIFRIYEDSHGDIWIAADSVEDKGLHLWERKTETFRNMMKAEGAEGFSKLRPHSFREDRDGNIWIGFSENGLARYRNGRFDFFTNADGLPKGWILDLLTDDAGRLWMASTLGGLARIDAPSEERPHITIYDKTRGLSSNKVTAVTKDKQGFIYAATDYGIDRLQPENNQIKHFKFADGAVGEIYAAYCDSSGTLWFGSSNGLTRFIPEPDIKPVAANVFIDSLTIAGKKEPLSVLGETEINLPDLAPNQNQLQIDFVALNYTSGETLRYQYKLEGADHDWSKPTEQREVNYSNLADGSYKFLVRVVSAGEESVSRTAVVSFRILPPIYKRWWFIAFCVLLFGSIAFAVYRYRVARLLEMANMRTRIATDLHDDIGANLTRIALLSEVAKQQLAQNENAENGTNPLSSIANIARESVSSMSDIVWAINPERDHLIDLIRKMRQHSDEIFTLREIQLKFNAPDPETNLKLGVAARRDLLLIFKEAVNNAARHSNCSKVEINFRVESRMLSLTIADDGKGFAPSFDGEGQGLRSMKHRAENLGGTLIVDSSNEHGTTVKFVLSLSNVRGVL